MNFAFLPDKVKAQLQATLGGRIPTMVVRASGDLFGQLGEGYLVEEGQRLLLFTRRIGESDFRAIDASLEQIAEFELGQTGGQAQLTLRIGAEQFLLKTSELELKLIEPLRQRWRQRATGAAPSAEATPATAPGPVGLTPLVGLVAALMHLAKADNRIAPEEDRYIVQSCRADQVVLQAALAIFREHSYERLLEWLRPLLNHEQKLCVLANLLELGMSDDAFRSGEQHLVHLFATAMELTEDEATTIRQVLLLKNQTAILMRKA